MSDDWRMRKRPHKIWSNIARQISTVAYGDFGIACNMAIVAYNNEGDKNTRFYCTAKNSYIDNNNIILTGLEGYIRNIDQAHIILSRVEDEGNMV